MAIFMIMKAARIVVRHVRLLRLSGHKRRHVMVRQLSQRLFTTLRLFMLRSQRQYIPRLCSPTQLGQQRHIQRLCNPTQTQFNLRLQAALRVRQRSLMGRVCKGQALHILLERLTLVGQLRHIPHQRRLCRL